MNELLSQQEHQDRNGRQQDHAAEGSSNVLDFGARNDNIAANMVNGSTLSGLRLMLQQISGDHDDEDGDSVSAGEESHDEHEFDDMEEDNESEDQNYADEEDDLLELLVDENESDSDDFASVAERDAVIVEAAASTASGDLMDGNDSVVMEDVNDVIVKRRRGIDQPRTISVSSDDL